MIKKEIVAPLLSWYDANKRILPWRENRDPYKIWVSEIMLQQTRVEAVKPYFDRFIKTLPNVQNLAEIEEEKLLKLWEGLGYYNRVKNMQKTARIIMEQYGGNMPSSYELLLQLPGIGSYTAGAVASIAFDEPVPAVDGNVLRILTRLTADSSDVLNPGFKKQMEQQLLSIMPKNRPGDFNQAMMELGATVCIPNGEPKCGACPWKDVCMAKAEGKIADIPYKTGKKPRKIEKKTVLILRDGDKTLIRKRPETGLLAGLFEFPTYDGWLTKKQIQNLAEEMGYKALYIKETEEAVHVFSHKEWHMKGYLVKVEESGFFSAGKENTTEHTTDNKNETEASRKVEKTGVYLILPEEIEASYPVPSAFKAFTKYVNLTLGNDTFLR